VVQPEVLTLEFPEHDAELHGKGGYIRGARFFSIKVVGSFPRNLAKGVPALVGSVFVFEAETGRIAALLLDNGFLT
jgi:ornithine cyclodeaminase